MEHLGPAGIAVLVGVMAIWLRKPYARYILWFQRKVWALDFGPGAERVTESVIVGIASALLGFAAIDLLRSILG